MRQLQYAGPGADAAHVIVQSPDGLDRFTLVLDEDLRAAARVELPRLDQPAAETGAMPSPREIQMRVRAGVSPELIAAEAGVDVDRVNRFAFPVLQERIRMADEARRCRARRTTASGELVVFGEVVDARLASHGIEPTEVTWDAFRRPDGQWTVTAGWRDGVDDRFAQWSFVPSSRLITPVDDTAGDLLSDRPLRPAVDDVVTDTEDEATVGGAWEPPGDQPPGLPEQTLPTGPIPAGLRLAGPLPAGYEPDPAPRGIQSFFAPRAVPGTEPGSRPASEPASEPVPARTRARTSDPTPDARDVPLPLAVDLPRADVVVAPEAPDAKAARARIPSWDDILLGVRRRGD